MRTPQWLFDCLDEEYGPFTLDAAACFRDAMCYEYYDKATNGLINDWQERTFYNPEFAFTKLWVPKALREWNALGNGSVGIVPVGCSQRWFHALLKDPLASIRYPTQRISFDLPNGKPTKGADRDTIIVAIGYSYKHKISPIDTRAAKREHSERS